LNPIDPEREYLRSNFPIADQPPGISVSLQVENKQFIGNGHLIGSSLRRTAYFFALICNRTGHAFSKSATGKTDVSFNV